MTATVRRLMSIAEVRRARLALAALARRADGRLRRRPDGHVRVPDLEGCRAPGCSLADGAIVGVRFFGLARPIARYFERLASHDVALRSLGRARARVYESIEPLAPAQLEDTRRGDLLSRFVADVDSLQNLYLRGLEPPLVALIAGAASVALAAVVLPAAGLVLAVGLLVGGIAVPALSVSIARRSVAQQADSRGALTAELVETLAGSAELAALGLERDRVRTLRRLDAAARPHRAQGRPRRRSRRSTATARDGRDSRRRSRPVRLGSCRWAPRPHADRAPRPRLARSLRGRPASDRVVPRARLDDRGRPARPRAHRPQASDRRPRASASDAGRTFPGRARKRASAIRAARTARAGQLQPPARCRARESCCSDQAAPGRRRSSGSCCASSIPSGGASPWAGQTFVATGRRTSAAR